jgi:hypothetical protein
MRRDPGSNQCIETEAYSIRLSSPEKKTKITTDGEQMDTYFFYTQKLSCLFVKVDVNYLELISNEKRK